MSLTKEQRFWAKVDKTPVCWNWTGYTTGFGYGQAGHSGKYRRAHQYSYFLENGEWDKELVIDHICNNRICVRPSHLRAVTQRENILRGKSAQAKNHRKSYCKGGHKLSGDNLYKYTDKNFLIHRFCRTCRRKYA